MSEGGRYAGPERRDDTARWMAVSEELGALKAHQATAQEQREGIIETLKDHGQKLGCITEWIETRRRRREKVARFFSAVPGAIKWAAVVGAGMVAIVAAIRHGVGK